MAAAVLLVLVAVLGGTGVLERAMHTGPAGALQGQVVTYLQASETKAVEAFAIARGINAAISVLKSTDLSAIVATVAPLEVLEPVDDLAKQFSDVMLASVVAIFVQRLILMISQAWALAVVLPVGCALLVLSLAAWGLTGWGVRLAAVGRTLVLLALFARFVILASGFVGERVTDRFLAADLAQSLGGMSAISNNLHVITAHVSPGTPPPLGTSPASQSPAPPHPASLLDRLGGAAQAVVNGGVGLVTSVGNALPNPSSVATVVAGLPSHMITAIQIFLVQTIITPFTVALIFYAVLRGVRRPAPLRIEVAPQGGMGLQAGRA